MTGNVANPRIWLNADVYVAPVGSTAPVDIVSAWAAPFLPLGLLSEDGMVESQDQSTTDYYAWGGILVRTVRSKFKRSFKVTALEDNKTVWQLVNPGSTAVTAATITTRQVKVPTSDIRAFGLQLMDGANTKRRAIPRGEVVAVADVKLSDSDLTGFELTINIYPDSSGVLYTEVTNEPAAIVP